MALPFVAVTLFLMAMFVAGLVERTFRASLPVYIVLMGTSAVGLWRVRSWGRSIGLIVAIGNAGIGALALVASMVSGEFHLGSALLLAASMGVAYGLSTQPFTLPTDTR